MSQQGTSVRERQDTHTEAPRSYRVWLLNDDFTPMDFVVEILCGLFDKAPVIAENIM
ncbi:MAG: ATP-dependent Clp protease adaptor ClpS, partial [Prevotellaceae bacterium]|nr:ATP-dependent Clp protease adaptor ClpS [Prevotellaceae bacterium]